MNQKTGIVNLATGKIFGVSKGSHGFFHEQGHIIYNDSEKGIRNRLNQGYVFDIMIASIIGTFIWKYFIFLSGALFIVYKGYDLYEERWAENYAKEMDKKESPHRTIEQGKQNRPQRERKRERIKKGEIF